MEPDTVVLRGPSGYTALRILEQIYWAETASDGLHLSLNEGNGIDFLVRSSQGAESIVRGRVIRLGYPSFGGSGDTPIVEVGGRLRFSLPGEPLLGALVDDAGSRPTASWQRVSDRAAQVKGELGYITGGLAWRCRC